MEPTDEPYAIAKIAGIKICDAYRSQYGCNFISAMPTNLYGPNDNFDLNNSQLFPVKVASSSKVPRSSKDHGHVSELNTNEFIDSIIEIEKTNTQHHYWKNDKGQVYLFCYEFGLFFLQEQDKEKYVLVKWQPFMEKP